MVEIIIILLLLWFGYKITKSLRLKHEVEVAARACHAAHLSYCKSVGEFHGVSWANCYPAHRLIVRKNVRAIQMNRIRTVQEAHDAFLFEKMSQGWTYGLDYNKSTKVSPRIKLWDQLSLIDKTKEEIFFDIAYSLTR